MICVKSVVDRHRDFVRPCDEIFRLNGFTEPGRLLQARDGRCGGAREAKAEGERLEKGLEAQDHAVRQGGGQ